ncbi:MAG: DEAD/DEAH box helicase family protein [Clostridiales bacterium]|nr:DEAD/DEAH box helicase family protein [Clostridiales bacterium]
MFEKVYFDGQFRSYQQSVLDRADEYLKDGRVHVVAAPGSGKTILGLELIRRLNSPCIILSPTTTIRNQWGERFAEHFVHGEQADIYLSYDLNNLAPITSVTYQALHAAMKRTKDIEDGEDYTTLDLIAEVKRYGIGTICLDEAHHLQNEWQKALENFLSSIAGEVRIVALTATPPYDAKPSEWNRYVNVCGEIDEEIFVPELVKQQTLCPHQDYLYFNYPTDDETSEFKAYRERANAAISEFLSSSLVEHSYKKLLTHSTDYDFLYSNTKEIVALLSLYTRAGIAVSKKLVHTITFGKKLPACNTQRMVVAINFLLQSNLLTEDERSSIIEIFKHHSVYERGEITLELNEKLKKRLVSSVGKLKSIAEIAKSENEHRGADLRMLVLTDYIRKESLSVIGTDKNPDTVSIVSVFETVRRTGLTVGALSGGLVILPDSCAEILQEYGASFSTTPLGDTHYSSYEFKSNNREKVHLVSKLFDMGAINVLVGTKSLLGEGWDAPCVNSLILASFVGSFMLSNQMRGRAIRMDKNQPDKTANIWHLVTVERPYLYATDVKEKLSLLANENINELTSYDLETVERRFDCFVAPNYDTGEIESGISRVTVIKPPFNEKGIERINNEMVKRSQQSQKLKSVWQSAVKESARLNEVSNIPQKGKTPPFLFVNIATACFMLSLFVAGVAAFVSAFTNSFVSESAYKTLIAVVAMLVCIVTSVVLYDLISAKILTHLSPVRSIRTLTQCVLDAMQELGIVSKSARVKVAADNQGIFILTELLNATTHEQNLFHNAIKDLLSPIENPRYLLIPVNRFGKLRYRYALACPEILGSKNEYAECLASKLKHSMGKIETVYTRTEKGRKLILTCRKASYITKNDNVLYGRSKHISHWE